MGILITGAAGFIGFHVAKRLLEEKQTVVGFDNLNEYYDVSLKQSRLKQLEEYPCFTFVKGDLADEQAVNRLFTDYRPEIVINLAAQAGVRYSLENPRAYVDSNVTGTFNVMEAARRVGLSQITFATQSSASARSGNGR